MRRSGARRCSVEPGQPGDRRVTESRRERSPAWPDPPAGRLRAAGTSGDGSRARTTTWPAARGTRSRSTRTWPRGGAGASGRERWSTCPGPIRRRRCSAMPSRLPMAIAPTAFHGLAHPDGELATARAAGVAGVPFILSTSSSRSIEEVAAAAPDATRWFQLYLQGAPGVSRSLVDRAADERLPRHRADRGPAGPRVIANGTGAPGSCSRRSATSDDTAFRSPAGRRRT